MLSSSRPVEAAFPEFLAGRLLHCVFRGLLSVHSRYGLHAREVTIRDPFHRSTSTALLPPPSLRLLPAERPVAGRESHPLKIDAFHGIQEFLTLFLGNAAYALFEIRQWLPNRAE
jgi:hypothetical protein